MRCMSNWLRRSRQNCQHLGQGFLLRIPSWDVFAILYFQYLQYYICQGFFLILPSLLRRFCNITFSAYSSNKDGTDLIPKRCIPLSNWVMVCILNFFISISTFCSFSRSLAIGTRDWIGEKEKPFCKH